jgi:protein O-GlcNAc transferase
VRSDTILVKDSADERNRRRQKTKIKLGYLSSDIKDHAVAHILSNFIEFHNKDKFEIFCYSSSPDNQTEYRKKIESASDSFIDIKGLGNFEAAKKINDDDIDILIEMNGHTKGSRIHVCSIQPTPVQVAYLGFLGTTGTDFIDYIITDKVVTHEDQSKNYSEKFAYLPDCYQVTDFSGQASSKEFTRKDFGIPEESIVFCSFNQPYKYEPVMFDVWMNILKKVPQSVLWLRQLSPTAENNLKNYAEQRQVSPERILFSAKANLNDHLKRLELAEIALDTRIYNGGATTNNALWAGLPVVTLQGDSFVSRMSSSSLTALGITELITHSIKEYEDLAVKLATDRESFEKIKNKIELNQKNMPLFNLPRFVSNLEAVYEKIWKLYLSSPTDL